MKDYLQTNRKFKCLECNSLNVSVQIYVEQYENLQVEPNKPSKLWITHDLDFDHDNVGQCRDCEKEVSIEEKKHVDLKLWTQRNIDMLWKEYPKMIGKLPKYFYDSSWQNNEFPSYNHETNNFIVWVQDWDFLKEEKVTQYYIEFGYRKEIDEDVSMYQDELAFSDWVQTWDEVLEKYEYWIKEYTKKFPQWEKEVSKRRS